MGYIEDCVRLNSLFAQVLESLSEIENRSCNLLNIDFCEIPKEISYLLEACNALSEQFQIILKQTESLSVLASIVHFLTSTGLVSIVKSWSFVASDASVVYDFKSSQRITDLKANPASDYYEKRPEKKVLGDLGELMTLKMLIDPNEKDALSEKELEEIQIKPFLGSTKGKDLNPDFFVPSRNLVCDAKTWKNLNSASLRATVQKYAEAECIKDGGEVRIYLPSDTYEQCQAFLEKFPGQIGNVRISIVPMQAKYKDLTWQREIMFVYLKSLITAKPPAT